MAKLFFRDFSGTKLAVILPAAILLTADIFIFIPFSLYKGNINELTVPFLYLLPVFLILALVSTAIFTAIGFLLPGKTGKRYVSLLFVLGLLVWIQGSFLVWNYGSFAGHDIDWTKGAWRGYIDGAIWIVLIAAGVFLYRKIYGISSFASKAILGVQMLYLVVLSIQTPLIWTKPMPEVIPPDEIYQFSSEKNVIHVLLDMFQSDIFKEIVDEKPEYYKKEMEGFTFFREAASSFPTTRMSIPAILTGKVYKNDVKINDFINTAFKGKTLPKVLKENGYEIDRVYSPLYPDSADYNYTFNIPFPYGITKRQHYQSDSTLIFDMTLFRAAPHFFKNYVYNDQMWLVQRWLPVKNDLLKHKNDQEFFQSLAQKAFFADLIKNVSVKRTKPVYKFIHITESHEPWVLNKDCVYAGKVLTGTRENVKTQQRCVLEDFIGFIDKLKEKGIYESSLIVVHADHGAGSAVKLNNTQFNSAWANIKDVFASDIAGRATPLLAVKPPSAKGLLKTSDAQVMLTDIPATVTSMLNIKGGFDGRSVFAVNPKEVRERRFYYYKWINISWLADYFDHLDEFIINGSLFDSNSWQAGAVYFSPNVSFQTQKVDFGADDSNRFMRLGWSYAEKNKEGVTFNWAIGHSSAIYLSLPKTPVVMTAHLSSYPFDKPQIVTVKVDGKEVGAWQLSPLSPPWGMENRSLVVGADSNRPKVSVVEFQFSQHRTAMPAEDTRPFAVAFESLSLGEFVPYKWGTAIQFGNAGDAGKYKTKGWSGAEAGHTWIDGKEASLVIPMEKPNAGRVVLKASMSPLLVTGKVARQRVGVIVNGAKAGEWILTKDEFKKQEKTLIIPAGLLAGRSSMTLTFETPDAISPKKTGISDDSRVLGVAVHSIEISEKR